MGGLNEFVLYGGWVDSLLIFFNLLFWIDFYIESKSIIWIFSFDSLPPPPPPWLLFTSPKLTFNSHESDSFVPGQYWNQNVWHLKTEWPHPVRFYACPRFAQRYYLPRAGKWNWTFKFLIFGLMGIKNQFNFGLAGSQISALWIVRKTSTQWIFGAMGSHQ